MNKKEYTCRIASLTEMHQKWDDEIRCHPGEEKWVIWKQEAISNYRAGKSIPYYGILGERIICEATSVIDTNDMQNGDEMMDEQTVYLCAFRTVKQFQGKGCFSKLMRFMLDDLKQKGFTRAILGVEPNEKTNKAIYQHWGFIEHIKSATEQDPDGTEIDVEYYGKFL